MKRIGRFAMPLMWACLISLVFGCRSLDQSYDLAEGGGQAGQPSFNIYAWQDLQKGPVTPAFGLQDQMYSIQIEANEAFDAKVKKPAKIRIFSAKGALLHEFAAKMRYRGSSSLNFPKKQYALSTANGEKTTLLGLAPADDYVLAAPYNDKSLLRDVLAYNLGNLMGRYAPKTRLATATIRIGGGEAAKLGIVVLTEKNEIAPGKLEIAKEVNGTSAYFLNVDRVKDGDRFVTSTRGTQVIIDYPKNEKLTVEREKWIKNYIEGLENSLADQTGEGWRELFNRTVDLNSAVDFLIMQELGRNVDGYRLSSAMYLPVDGKMHFGPIWDFNLAFGNANYYNGQSPEGWRALATEEGGGMWFRTLMLHPAFCEQLKQRWSQLRQTTFSNNSIFNVIDSHRRLMDPHVDENFQIWGGLGRYLWPNAYWLASFGEEQHALKSWVALRAQWLDRAVQELTCSL
jgi:hypothetical protein